MKWLILAICAEIGTPPPYDQPASVVLAPSAPGLYGDRRRSDEDWRRGFSWWRGQVVRDAARLLRAGQVLALSTQAGATDDEDFPGWAAVVGAGGDVVSALPDWRQGHLVVRVDEHERKAERERLDAERLARERLVALEQRLVLGTGHRIVRITVGTGVLAHDGRARVRLAGEMAEFRDARVVVVVRVVHGAHGLEPFLVQRFMLEAQGAVGQAAEAAAELGQRLSVDRPRRRQGPGASAHRRGRQRDVPLCTHRWR